MVSDYIIHLPTPPSTHLLIHLSKLLIFKFSSISLCTPAHRSPRPIQFLLDKLMNWFFSLFVNTPFFSYFLLDHQGTFNVEFLPSFSSSNQAQFKHKNSHAQIQLYNSFKDFYVEKITKVYQVFHILPLTFSTKIWASVDPYNIFDWKKYCWKGRKIICDKIYSE